MKKIVSGLIFAIIILTLAGCAKDKNVLPYQGDSAKYIYAIGHSNLKEGNYNKSIEAYRSLNAQYPFEYYSKLGSLDLIYAYYQSSDPAMALATANQYLRLYPTSKNIGYVYYMMGVLHFDNGRGFMQRRLPYDMAKHDTTNYKKAFYEFKKSVMLDPKAAYAQDAQRRMVYLLNIIAEYEYNIAKFNYTHDAYVAAIDRARTVVEKYPRSEVVEAALVLMVKSYRALDLPVLANASSVVLKTNFPNNSYLKGIKIAKETPTVIIK